MLEKHTAQCAQALIDVVDDSNEDMAIRVVAAKAVFDHALQAQESIAVEEVLVGLRATIEKLREIKTPALRLEPIAEKLTEARIATENEQAEAALLRVSWMGEIGHTPEDIAASLRHNRPTSAAEEQHLLDLVRKQLEWERACEEAMGTGR